MPFIYPKLNRFKKYTGKGLTPRGNVRIDENGIATGFSNINYNIVSDMTTAVFQKPFTVQIKYKINDNKWGCLFTTTYDGYPAIEFSGTNDHINFIYYSTKSGSQNLVVSVFSDDQKIGEWRYLYAKFDGEKYVIEIRNKNIQTIDSKEVISAAVPRYQETLVIGRDVDYTNSAISTDYEIDLSETFILDGDGNVISSWNLD